MKTWKKLTALLLAAVMGMGLTGTAFAAEKEYADVAGHWAEAEIRLVTELGLVDGKSAGVFGPDENMTRGDLVLALYRLAKSPALDAGMDAHVSKPLDVELLKKVIRQCMERRIGT